MNDLALLDLTADVNGGRVVSTLSVVYYFNCFEGTFTAVKVELKTDRLEYARSIGLRKQVRDFALFDSTPSTTFRVLDDKVSSADDATWWTGYHDEEFQKLFAEARQQLSEADRVAAYEKCLQILQQDPPWLYISHPEVVWVSRKGVKISVESSGVLSLDGQSVECAFG